MKKLVLIVGLVLVAASCQKEQIVPKSSVSRTGNTSAIMASPTNDNSTSAGTLSTATTNATGTSATGPSDTNPSTLDDDITDPMRKKERKGN